MKRSTRAFVVTCLLVAIAPVMHAEYVVASPVDDQRREVERIVDELERLEEQSDILTEDYVVAVDDKSRLDQEVADAEQRVAAKEAELDELRGELSEVAVRSFTGSGTDVLGPLFSNAGTYNDTLQRDQYSRVALSVGTATTDDLDELIADLDAERSALESKRAQAQALTEQISAQKVSTDALREEYLDKRAEAEAELGELIAEEEQRRAEEAFRQIQAEAAAAEAAAAQQQQQQQQSNPAPASPVGNGGNGGNGGNAATPSGDSGSGGGASLAAPAAPAPAPSYPAPSSRAQVAINAALGQLGVPYVYATSLPGVSFDCSGLTHYAWGQAGVYLPRNSRAQAAAMPHVPVAAAQPGDLLFYYSPISHVGIYLGGGQIVHAPNSGTTVKVATVNWGKVSVVARPG
jgi:cell wall-associated NlpC family hydrolase